ncbi:MAG: 3-methyl-2-oxobutanoate hydroxymethyltransferase [Chloroflexota bacterium]|nr:3-methyl-2-oxobutanoate hydroxymethyltransferase [Dehalococcoidia bacterium]MDW8253181.1 3-methyl-2-oxobutanoate hydroxymethyltransferase [Chloroflexota bacterium]
MQRLTIHDLRAMKARGEPIAMLTAYDYPTAKLLDEAGVPALLVGDSLGMAVLGYDSTLPVTLEDVIYHLRAVVRGARRALIIGDMPFMTYQADPGEAMKNAGRLLAEGGAGAVKVEGGRWIAPTVARLVQAGIPVMGHLGLTPQSVHQLGGYKVQGKSDDDAARILADAQALQEAGAFAIVLEYVPADLARAVTAALDIPTIGIGAGPFCDGQVQVITDLLGLEPEHPRRHAKVYAPVGELIRDAARRYVDEVQRRLFPTDRESFGLAPREAAAR